MQVRRLILAVTACALCAAIPLAAATPSASKTKNATKAAVKASTKTNAARSVWPPETLSGKIAAVDPDHNRVVVETADRVPYDMVVTAATKIKAGNRALTLKELSQDKNKNASVNFTPERRGDMAKSIQLGG